MKSRSIPSIRSRLALLVMACIIPAGLMVTVLVSFDYYRARAQLVEISIARARSMASLVDQDFASIGATLHALATSPSLSSHDLSAFYRQSKSLLENRSIKNIVLTDPAGLELVNVLLPAGIGLPQSGNFIQLKKIAEADDIVISNLYVGSTSQQERIAISLPVRREGKHVYTINAIIAPENLAKMLAQQHLPSDWISAVLDSSGTIVARTHDMSRFIGKNAPADLLHAIALDSEGSLEGFTSEGIASLGVFSRSGISNWVVAIGIPTKELTSTLRITLSWIVLVTLGLLAGSLGLAWIIGGKIARSITGLTQPALNLGLGQEVKLPPIFLREADEVGQALLKASKMLHEAQYRASHDGLTGLANRSLFNEIVNPQLLICERNGMRLSILYIDLDGFKSINDTLGHNAGDQLLREVAQRLKTGIRKSDVAARLGGDEFAVVLLGETKAAATLAKKLVDILSVPYEVNQTLVQVSASIGVAEYPECGTTCQELLRRADDAMYQAKAAGKGQVMHADAGYQPT